MDVVTARWVGNRQFVAWDRAGHGIVMDATAEFRGEGTGVRPIELVLYGLVGCTAMDVVSVLEKKRERVSRVEVTASGFQRVDDHPRYYERIEVCYDVSGVRVSEHAVKRAIELSEQKYCSVRGMFGAHVEIVSSFTVTEDAEHVDTGG